ncbi:MAG: hypothetical protein IPG34_03510 [Rhodocyclaceae bacterium]|nr:hypothetical protein [Rhodocyclaceae bacterium]
MKQPLQTPANVRACIFRLIGPLMLGAAASFCSVSAYADSSNDPTTPPAVWLAAESAQTEGKKVSPSAGKTGRVVVLGKTRRLAVVDGKVVKAGDPLNGSRVMAVQNDKVVTEDEARSLIISPNVSKPAPNRTPTTKKAVVLPAVATEVPTAVPTGDSNAKQ